MIYVNTSDTTPSIQSDEIHHQKGIVLWGTKNIYKVRPILHDSHSFSKNDFEIIECRLKGKRGDVENTERTFLLAGDLVEYQITENGFGIITQRLERKNSIIRKKNDTLQPIVVNIDMLLLVSSVQSPPFRPRFMDRLIYIANCEHIPILVVLNKIDLVVKDIQMKNEKMDDIEKTIPRDLRERIDVYKTLGIDVLYASVMNNFGIDMVKQKLEDKYVGVVGQSGVGKSSMINALVPYAELMTGDVSQKYNRGKHITTRPELVYAGNFCIIDTPGIRDLYPQEMDITSLIRGFPEIYQYASKCKLPDCSHRNEPQCGVVLHVGKEIHEDRYESYLSLREAMEEMDKGKWKRQKR